MVCIEYSSMPHDAPHTDEDSTRVVLLHHTLSDGSSHFDWMIEIPDRTDEHRLLSFRCDERPDLWIPGELFHVEQLPHHRAHYLDFQGDIGGGRGVVVRRARGRCVGFRGDADGGELVIQISWEEIEGEPWIVRYFGEKAAQNRWCFRSEQIGLA